jgi:predicted TIM-barrel fold metal-dependent hydrolase
MGFNKDIFTVDLMLGIPEKEDRSDWYTFMEPLLRDEESKSMFKMPAQYMFKDINYPDRFFFDLPVNPNTPNEAANIKRIYEEFGIKAVSAFPSGMHPQVAINDEKWHPIYEMCVELDLPFFCCVGVPGPRIPMAPQKVELIDEVCWYFPELKFVMRHGAEPWTALACKLMLKYPNLYYSTSAFSPKHYPEDIVNFANTRGKDKIMYAGYFPMGLSLDKIFAEMENVPFKDDVWPKFLGENAKKLLKL